MRTKHFIIGLVHFYSHEQKKNLNKNYICRFFLLLILSSPPLSHTASVLNVFQFHIICPLWIKNISLAASAYLQGAWCIGLCDTESDPALIPTIASKYQHSQGKWEHKTRNNSRCCICWKGTELRSVDDSVTVLLIFFLILVRMWCKINASAVGNSWQWDLHVAIIFRLFCEVWCYNY